ncbi:hypothetical protein PVL30_001693 [Lodderomyces elongisporus]|uniref:uncharacterized protein n=1 Tax=Lodderomyces elongisporus TaxID=36914 RepID=UPI002925199F|nr:uncharacterized protein PVL30_001693 [Lodderomyces elongisporus]WLF77970.1 hypothetical protein PVL30_001693 [Lodderomyces elongisporus]
MSTLCTTETPVTLETGLDVLVDISWRKVAGDAGYIIMARLITIIEEIQALLDIKQLFNSDEMAIVESYIKDRPTTRFSKQDVKIFIEKSIHLDSFAELLRDRFGMTSRELRYRIHERNKIKAEERPGVSLHSKPEVKIESDNWKKRASNTSSAFASSFNSGSGSSFGISFASKYKDLDERLNLRRSDTEFKKNDGFSSTGIRSNANNEALLTLNGDDDDDDDELNKLARNCNEYRETCKSLKLKVAEMGSTVERLERTIFEQEVLILKLKKRERFPLWFEIYSFFTSLCFQVMSQFSKLFKLPADCIDYVGTHIQKKYQNYKLMKMFELLQKMNLKIQVNWSLVLGVLIIVLLFASLQHSNQDNLAYIYETNDQRTQKVPGLTEIWRRIPVVEQWLYSSIEW